MKRTVCTAAKISYYTNKKSRKGYVSAKIFNNGHTFSWTCT